jgi:hypothetical protein
LLISDCYVGNDAGCSRSLSLNDICNYWVSTSLP